MTGDDPDDFPVGRCTSCPYPEPHRHGPACDGTCVCRRRPGRDDFQYFEGVTG